MSLVRGRPRSGPLIPPPITLEYPIQGRTIELRPFTEDDAEAMLRVYGDPEVMRWVGHGAVSGIEAVRSMLQQYMAHQALHGFAFWAVVDRATGLVIGDGGLARTTGGEIEMGYTLARDAWGGAGARRSPPWPRTRRSTCSASRACVPWSSPRTPARSASCSASASRSRARRWPSAGPT